MALTYGFYNSVEGDRTYDAIQMGQIFDGIITDGVYATFLKAMVVKASENASEVIVQPGRCWFNHTWTYIDADYPVEAPVPEVILDRIDALVIDINSENAFRENSLIWVQGTPSSLNPERPTLIKSVTHNQYPLCYVYRKAGTTMIYAADITNAVGTSETPFVTGVLEGINIDDLLAQWDDEFHTWEAATKTSFEAWMVNQQSVYVTWFNSIKDQMEGDLTSFEEWFETIRGIIDEEAATHLQAEIDELRDMLPAGSHIDVSTTESTLFNRNVTVSDGVHSKTVQFDASGAATVESFPYIGIIDVSSTDGERTASESLNIPYFGRYSALLAFWSATVNLVGDESLAAIPITVRDGNGDVVAVVTLNASGQGTFTATKPDTYKFIYTYGGQTMEVSLAVMQETTYEVEIHGGFDWMSWLEAGRVSEAFSSLDDVLEDEPTLRQLFLVHDSVDYICDTFNESMVSIVADITKIFNTDLAAKWINLSDYALDHFYAVDGIKSIMDTADKYGYGEWVITDSTTTPPTWAPKGNVPKMTSNTAPYGTAFASGTADSAPIYYAFNGNRGNQVAYTGSPSHVGYMSPNPLCVKMLSAYIRKHPGAPAATNIKLQGSNDGNTYVDLGNVDVNLKGADTEFVDVKLKVNANSYFLYHRAVFTPTTYSSGNYATYILELQFYGRELKAFVPAMTSDSAPYGYASGGDWANPYYPWKVFDGTNTNESDCWYCGVNANSKIYYVFINPIIVKKVLLQNRNHSGNYARAIKDFSIQGSNDGTSWDTLGSYTNTNTSAAGTTLYDINTDDYYSRLQISVSTAYTAECAIGMLQYYGLDYSEKEFEVGTTKKWLYDHGVELEEFDTVIKGSSTTSANPQKDSNEIYLVPLSGTNNNVNNFMLIGLQTDLTDYDLLRIVPGKRLIGASTNNQALGVGVWSSMPSSSNSNTYNIAGVGINTPLSNLNIALNVSSIEQSDYYIFITSEYANGRSGSITELWLE